MFRYFGNRFFRWIFWLLFVLFGALLFIIFSLRLSEKSRLTAERTYQETWSRAGRMVRILDEKFSMIDRIEKQISGSRWIRYVGAESELLYSRVDYFGQKEIGSELNMLNILLETSRQTAVILPGRNLAVSGEGFKKMDAFYHSLSLSEELIDVLHTVPGTQESGLRCLPAADGDSDFMVVKPLSYKEGRNAFLFVYIDDSLFQRFLKTNCTEASSLSILERTKEAEGEAFYVSGAVGEEEGAETVQLDSEFYPWSYRFSVKVDTSAEEGITYSVFAYPGLLLLAFMAAYLLSMLIYRPFILFLERIGLDREEARYGLRGFERIYRKLQEEKNEMERMADQYHQIGQKSLLINILSGNSDPQYLKESMQRFKIGFRENMRYQVMVFQLFGEDGDRQLFLDEMKRFQALSLARQITAVLLDMDGRFVMIFGGGY